jgi:ferredoxin
MKVRIDPAKCVGHGMCRIAAPEIFDLDDEDGHGVVLVEDVPPGLEDAVEQAERGCPESAVIVKRD